MHSCRADNTSLCSHFTAFDRPPYSPPTPPVSNLGWDPPPPQSSCSCPGGGGGGLTITDAGRKQKVLAWMTHSKGKRGGGTGGGPERGEGETPPLLLWQDAPEQDKERKNSGHPNFQGRKKRPSRLPTDDGWLVIDGG